MRFAALTGGRVGALVSLRVRDCQDGWFSIRKDKTRSGRRRVPIHSDLASIVGRRVANKAPDDWLFEEIKTDKLGERTSAVSKPFTAYRQSLGIEDKAEGERRSRIVLHSFRNWFITEAIRAGSREHVVQQVVGHKAQGVNPGVYFGGEHDAALRACVESVRLPAGVPAPTP